MLDVRPMERYGPVLLSVQASASHYSRPRVDGLELDAYEAVEVGLLHDGRLCRPSEVGVRGFDHLFEAGNNPVAPYVPQEEVARLRAALQARLVRDERR